MESEKMYYENYKDLEHEDGLCVAIGMVENVSVAGGTKRGEVLAATSGLYSAVSSAGDAAKPLAIAAEDNLDTDTKVLPVFTKGTFHTDKLIVGEGLDLADFKESLRKDNLLITGRMN